MGTAVSSLLETITPFSAPSKTTLDTENWFDPNHVNTVQSPVDEFRSNLSQINVLYLQADQRGEYTPMLGSLVYLGMVSVRISANVTGDFGSVTASEPMLCCAGKIVGTMSY